MKNTNSITVNKNINGVYNIDSAPPKTGSYRVLFQRAKSVQQHEGTAKFVKSKNAWNNLHGSRGPVNDSYDSRDCRLVAPKIVGWAEA